MHPALASLYAATLQFTLGLIFTALLSDWRREVTPGFLRLTTVAGLCSAGVVLLLGSRVEPAEQIAGWAMTLLLLVYSIQQWKPGGTVRLAVGVLTCAAGAGALMLAAWARPGPLLGFGWMALAGLTSALVLGTSIGALVLGHWYLVTPRLSSRPLRLLCDLAVLGLVALSGLAAWFVIYHPEAVPLGPNDPLLLWTGLAALTVFPIAVTLAARACCQEWPRGRAIQAATGLLYVVAALVLAGALAGNMVLLSGPA